MNVIEILWELGWQVLSFNQEGQYTICLSGARRMRIFEEEKKGIDKYNDDIFNIFTVEVGEVSFNEGGDLYVSFAIVGTGELLDVYEYRNMSEKNYIGADK